jgi:hypothetical protein
MFYELDHWDFLGTGPHKRDTGAVMDGTFEATLDKFAQITLLSDPNAYFSRPPPGTSVIAPPVDKLSVLGIPILIPNMLPDG